MLAARLRDRALGPLRRLRGRKHATLGELMMHFLTGPLSACITEARASFAMVDRQPTVTWLTEHFKSAILQMKTEWRELIVPAMDAQVLDDYAAEALHRHPEYWRVLGFASQDAYRETVAPTTKSLLAGASAMHVEFLTQLAEHGTISIERAEADGYSHSLIVDCFNKLARDNWANQASNEIRLTPVGRQLLKKALTEASRPKG